MSDGVASLASARSGDASLNPGVEWGAVAYLDDWLQRLQWAVIIVTDGLQCRWVNPAAHKLADRGVIRLVEDRLEIGDADTTDRLKAFVAGIGSLPATWVTQTDQGDHLIVRADAVEPRSLPRAVALTVKCASDSHRHWVWADLRRAFGLTRSEALIVTRLVEGDRAEDIAAGLGLALDTVRSHIRSSYAKLDVGAREQLFAKVLPFRTG